MPKRKAEPSGKDVDEYDLFPKKRMTEDDADYEDDAAEFDDDVSDDDGVSPAADSENSAALNSGANTAQSSISVKPRRNRFPSDLKTIKCPREDCDRAFNRPARLAAHIRSHNNDRPFKCEEEGCDKTYLEEKHLRQHVDSVHKDQRSFKCDWVVEKGICGKAFLTSTRLARHRKTHEAKEEYRCKKYPPCNETFRKHSTLSRHERTAHEGRKAYICAEKGCDAGFDSQGALRNHTKKEHAEPEFWCEECGKEIDDNGEPLRVGFATITLLQSHIRAEHLKCAFCDHQCKGQAELEQHIENFHSDSPMAPKKTFPCEYEGCSKTFSKRSNMSQHVRNVHQGHRFRCGEVEHGDNLTMAGWNNANGCGQDFTTKANLETHIRHVHLGQARTRQTNPVNPTPGRSGNLMNTLTGVNRTMTCSVPGCGEHFARQIDLDNHMHMHTANLEPYEAALVGLADQPATMPNQDQFDNDNLHLRGSAPLPFQGNYQPVIQRQEPFMGMTFDDNNTAGQSQFAPQTAEPESSYLVNANHHQAYTIQDPGFLTLSQTQIGRDWVQETEDLPTSDFQQCVDPALGLNRLG